ncbi:hypothetical protein VD0004_g8099 [Verticillium dahliae]|nr:hypothetical protein VD0004_g8099 [Verticillium dahliae]PNH66928.1 hypothetical protein VD0001_g7986 [Verticillium dahliae]
MPPAPSQKGTGKKSGAGAIRQRSRNTTPSSLPPTSGGGGGGGGGPGGAGGGATGMGANLPPIEAIDAEYLALRVEQFRNITYDDLVDPGAPGSPVPDAKSVDGLIARLTRLQEVIDRRTNFCDKAMRDLSVQRKHHVDEVVEKEDVRTEDDRKRSNKKKRKAADSLAPGDTNHKERSSPLRGDSTKPRKLSRDSISSSLSPVEPGSPSAMDVDDKKKSKKKKDEKEKKEDEAVEDEEDEEESSSEDEGAPPRRDLPAAHTFGDDPSTFPDPTVYEIREAKPATMSEEELKEIYSVAVYPKHDLAELELIAGDPPDKDFSNAKPSNQISFSTFSAYIEPYFRPFTEEDLGFLRERGDRVAPFHMPKRGKRHYTEIWAEEDGAMQVDSPSKREKLAPNVPRGTIDVMDDEVGETDKLSVGPLLSRLVSIMRPESRPPTDEDKPNVNGTTNGDVSMAGSTNGENGDLSMSFGGGGGGGGEDNKPPTMPPATFMAESNSESWKKATHPKLDYAQVDERIKQELKHMGFLPHEGPIDADYDGAFDDEVAARLRLLQDRLRSQMLINGARKARLTELVKERMAHQEYQTILEDLDSQVQAAYLKRTRTMGKSKKAKRPAGNSAAAAAAAAGMARPGIGDVTKMLMERRARWIGTIGSVFEDENLGKVPRVEKPGSSIFKPAEMAQLLKREKEQWDEEVEEE